MKLSIIIPVFNEEKTIITILERVINVKLLKAEKEIIIVDDGSQDKTAERIKKYLQKNKAKSIIFIQQKENQGKGAAVRVGIERATGDYIVIQDADLEYNPQQIISLLTEVVTKNAQVVYGSRLNRLPHFLKEENRFQFFLHYMGNRFLSLLTSILYGQWITDMETCYKLFPASVIKKIHLKARGFELEPELTAKLRKAGMTIREIPIIANPRGYEEGKKLNTITDGMKAVYALLYYRFHE